MMAPRAETLLYGKNADDECDGVSRTNGGSGGGRKRNGRGSLRDVALFPGVPVDLSTGCHVVCCVDDTDDLSGLTSTGYVAEQIADQIAVLGGQVILGITRHQLLLNPAIPYTSHNSSMCFSAIMPQESVSRIIECGVQALEQWCAESADPGLCVAELPPDVYENQAILKQIEHVVAFGRRAKEIVCTKDEAYALARTIPWLHLSEHGGTGQGIIGALAGVGLRLSGNDGRFRGKWDLRKILLFQNCQCEDNNIDVDKRMDIITMPTGRFREELSSRAVGDVKILDTNGNALPDDIALVMVDDAKPIFHGGALTFVAEVREGYAWPYGKGDLDRGNNHNVEDGCWKFVQDNDIEECADALTAVCSNCLYRRRTMHGFECVVTDTTSSGE